MSQDSDGKVKVTVEVDVPRSKTGFQALWGGYSVVTIKSITLPPHYCKVDGGPEIQIKLVGAALNLQGYGFPADGIGLNFGGNLTEIPPLPGGATTNLPNAAQKQLDFNGGTWEVILDDQCADGATSPRTVVIWYRYENTAGDEVTTIDVCQFNIPDCDSITIPCD